MAIGRVTGIFMKWISMGLKPVYTSSTGYSHDMSF